MTNEFFPPTEEELTTIIAALKKQLEDESYRDEWKTVVEELKHRENQLKQLTIQNNLL